MFAPHETPPPLDPDKHGLFLDIDGTVVEIESRPEQVTGDEALRASLRDLASRLNGAVAVITGRSVIDADRILGGAVPHVAGVHGLERKIGGLIVSSAATNVFDADLRRNIFAIGAILDAAVEEKEGGFAIHYRAAPQFGDLVCKAAGELAQRHGLRIVHGKMVAEILAPGPTKGDMLIAYMAEAPFAGRVPVVVGDDVTDEDAFEAARRLGGFAVLVGPERASAAAYRLDTVTAARRWLASGCAA